MRFFFQRRRVKVAQDRPLYRRSNDFKNENPYLGEVIQLRKTIPHWDDFFCTEADESRNDSYVRLDVLGQPLCRQYAWAIPDDRALRILQEFSPLIEIGAGRGYWASLLKKAGVDIIAFDRKVPKKCFTDVAKGGPSELSKKANKKRTLFLCYPDDTQNMSMKCLEKYDGEYIIHVGELMVTGTVSGHPQAPFGRTTSSEFNVQLAEEFHCLLTARLPRFPFSNDCISVWKRTKWVEGRQHDDEEDGEGDAEEDSEDNRNYWASIPREERLPLDRAAPLLQHLL